MIRRRNCEDRSIILGEFDCDKLGSSDDDVGDEAIILDKQTEARSIYLAFPSRGWHALAVFTLSRGCLLPEVFELRRSWHCLSTLLLRVRTVSRGFQLMEVPQQTMSPENSLAIPRRFRHPERLRSWKILHSRARASLQRKRDMRDEDPTSSGKMSALSRAGTGVAAPQFHHLTCIGIIARPRGCAARTLSMLEIVC